MKYLLSLFIILGFFLFTTSNVLAAEQQGVTLYPKVSSINYSGFTDAVNIASQDGSFATSSTYFNFITFKLDTLWAYMPNASASSAIQFTTRGKGKFRYAYRENITDDVCPITGYSTIRNLDDSQMSIYDLTSTLSTITT